MSRVMSRRSGGAGINTSTINGFLQFVAGSDPSVRVFASQAQAEAGSDNVTLMTPLRVAQAIAELATPSEIVPIGVKRNQSSAPTTADNASVNDDDGHPLAAGSYWQHVINSPITAEGDVAWYRLEGFAANGDAIWHSAEQIAASVITAIEADITDANAEIATLQTNVTTLTNQLAVVMGIPQFESPAIFALSSGQRTIELDHVPIAKSVNLRSMTSGGAGLAPLFEVNDFTLFGSMLFLRDGSGSGDATVENGDYIDLDYVRDAMEVAAVTSPTINSTKVEWTAAAGNDEVEAYKCLAASDPTLRSSWVGLKTGGDRVDMSDEEFNHGLAEGDRVIIRTYGTGLDGEANYSAWSDILTVPV